MTRVAVIGGGHNGLVCACFLANAGLDVTVFEANATVGGCIWTEQLPSGHRLERGAIDHGLILGIAGELGLDRFGLEYAFREVSAGAGFGDGTRLLFHRDLSTTLAGFGGLDPADIEGYRRLAELGTGLLGMMDAFVTPPSLAQIAELGSVAGFDPLRTVLTSAEKVVGAHVGDPHLAAALAMYGAFSQVPPWLPGSGLFGLLLAGSHGHGAGRPIGGSVQLVNALVRALESAGGKVRTSAAVASIDRSGAESRITTAQGDTAIFDLVVSALDVARTARLMAEPVPELDEAARMVTSGSLNVAEFKVDLALSAEAEPGQFGHPEAIWLLQQSPGSMARSFGEIAAGTFPSEPAMLWASPSALDPSAAPEGGGVAWLSTFVPARLRHGEWTGAEVSSHAERVIDGYQAITGVSLRDRIVDRRVTGPVDWEKRTGARFGNPNHIDMTIDQMFSLRPGAGRGYRTAVPWLYLTGAGTFPGGGLSGVPGKNAALTVLDDLGSRRSRQAEPSTISALVRGWRLYRSLRQR